MGDPTPDPDDRTGCKCIFDEPGCWTIPPDWSFDDDIAIFGPRSGVGDTKLICPFQMVVGQIYKIQFEIFDSIFFPADSFVIEISSLPGGFSTGFSSDDQHTIFLTHLEEGYPLKLIAECPWNDPTSFKVKNFLIQGAAPSSAYSESFLPLAATKNEIVLSSQTEASVLLAHWLDKSNCLIKYKT